MISPDGTVLTSKSEVLAEAQTVTDRSPSSVLQVFGGKGTIYEIGFGGESGRIHMVIDDLGRLVSFASQANFAPGQPGEKPKP